MLFYLSKKDTKIPITSIKGFVAGHVVLLTGERLKDDDPQIVNLYGTEDVGIDAVYSTIIELTKSLNTTTKHMQDTREEILKEMAEMKKQIQRDLAATAKATATLRTSAAEAIEICTKSGSNMLEASSSVKHLGAKLYESIQQLEADVAETQTF